MTIDRTLGVLGGMGPLATAHFLRRLVELTPATRDQDHVPVVVWSDPRVPDRVSAALAGTESPVPAMLRGVAGLEAAGCGAIAIACNTAYCWYEELAAKARVPILHIVDAIAADLAREGIAGGPVGLIGTAATLAAGLYQRELGARGYACLVPGAAEMETRVAPAIRLVKENRPAEARPLFIEAIAALKGRGARATALVCTEVPVALAAAATPAPAPLIVDSTDALARAAIAWAMGAADARTAATAA